MESSSHSFPTIRDLFPSFNDEQLRAAEESLDEYLQLVASMYSRIVADPEAYARFRALTVSEPYVTIRAMRSKPTNDNGSNPAT